MNNLNNNINKVTNLENNGFVIFQSFLDKFEVNLLYKAVYFQCLKKGSKENYFSINYNSIFNKFFSLKFKKAIHHLNILKIINKKKLKDISELYFKQKSKLHTVDGYISEISDNSVIPWHCDKAYSENTTINDIKKFVHPKSTLLKFFIYLTDVGPGNGCTSYIPKSHKIADIIRKGIYSNEIIFSPYWSLEQFKNFISIKKNYDFIRKKLKNKNEIDEFILKTKNLNNNENSNFDFFAKAGDMIVFDESGIHRGSPTTKSSRVILRVNYRRQNIE